MAKMKIKAKSRKNVITVRVLIKHPMETGNRKVKGKLMPANHIIDLLVTKNGEAAIKADIGSTISTNPFFQFKIPGVKGDTISVSFNDNHGKSLEKTKQSK